MINANAPMKLRNGKNLIWKTVVVKNTALGNARSTCNIPAKVSNSEPVCAQISTKTMKTAALAMIMSEFNAASTTVSFKALSLLS